MESIEIHEGKSGIAFFSLTADDREVGRMMVSTSRGILRAGRTVVDSSHRNKGYGKKLVDAVVDYARKNDLKVVPDCGFVAMTFNKYPDLYEDIRGMR